MFVYANKILKLYNLLKYEHLIIMNKYFIWQKIGIKWANTESEL